MARTRVIKPQFFTNDDLGALPPVARILFQGLWCIADREGRLEDRPARIKVEVLPYDDVDANELLQALHDSGFIERYTVENKKYIQVTKFLKHQQPHYKEATSEIPAPGGHVDSVYPGGPIPPALRRLIFERDGFKCLSCGSTEKLSIDHIIPQSRGGAHAEANLQTLCLSCNSTKRNNEHALTSSHGHFNESDASPPLTLNPSPLTLNPSMARKARRPKASRTPELDEAISLWKSEGCGAVSQRSETRLRGLIAANGVEFVTQGIKKAAEQGVTSPMAWLETVVPSLRREAMNGQHQGNPRKPHPNVSTARPGSLGYDYLAGIPPSQLPNRSNSALAE